MARIDFMTIATWLGHKDGGILVGKVYGHLLDEHRHRVAKQVNFGFPLKSEIPFMTKPPRFIVVGLEAVNNIAANSAQRLTKAPCGATVATAMPSRKSMPTSRAFLILCVEFQPRSRVSSRSARVVVQCDRQ